MPVLTPKFDVYKFIAPYEYSTGALNLPKVNFKIGDAIIGGTFVSNGTVNPPTINGGTSNIRDLNGAMVSVPASVLKKVATRIENSEIPQYVKMRDLDLGLPVVDLGRGKQIPIGENNTQKSITPAETKSFFTPTKIIVGLAIIGVVIGVLKYKKVF